MNKKLRRILKVARNLLLLGVIAIIVIVAVAMISIPEKKRNKT